MTSFKEVPKTKHVQCLVFGIQVRFLGSVACACSAMLPMGGQVAGVDAEGVAFLDVSDKSGFKAQRWSLYRHCGGYIIGAW